MSKLKPIILNIILIVTVAMVFILFSVVVHNHLAKNYVSVNDRIEVESKDADGVVSLSVKLPEEKLVDDGVLSFVIYSAVVEAYYHEELIGAFGQEDAVNGRMLGQQYCFVSIPDVAWGDELKIVLRPTEKNALEDLSPQFYVVEKNMTHIMPICSQPAAFFIVIILMAIGIFGTVVCIFGIIRKQEVEKGLYICLSALLISIWMICADGFYVVFNFTEYFWKPLEYISGFLCAIPLLMLYENLSRDNDKWNRAFKMALTVMVVENVIVNVFNFTNILHFHDTKIFMYLLIFACILLIAGHSFAFRKKDAANRALVTGFSIFIISCGIEVGILIFPTERTWGYFTNLISIGVLLLFVYLLIYVYIDNTEERTRAMLLQMRTERLKSELEVSKVRSMVAQMQPHFLYNALASIQEIIYEDPDYASKVVGDFATYLRGAVRAMSDVQRLPFVEELKNIKAYVEIERVRLGDRLEVEYQIEDEDFEVPPLSIQPLVENAIRHGVYQRGPAGGKVILRTFEEQDNYILKVIDDGVGFDVEKIQQEVRDNKRDSAGMKNLISRLEMLSKASVNIDSVIGVGTTVTVTIPKDGGQ